MRDQTQLALLALSAFENFGCKPGHWITQDDLDSFAHDVDLAQKDVQRGVRRAIRLGWVAPFHRGCFQLTPEGAEQRTSTALFG